MCNIHNRRHPETVFKLFEGRQATQCTLFVPTPTCSMAMDHVLILPVAQREPDIAISIEYNQMIDA